MQRHPTDLVSFVPGVLFVAIAVVALAGQLRVDLLDVDWAWPVTLILLGVVVLASSGRSTRSRDGDEDEQADGAGSEPGPGGDTPGSDPVAAPDDEDGEATWP